MGKLKKYTHRSQHLVQEVQDVEFLTDDNICRMQCIEMMQEIPIEKLKTMFNFRTVKPFSKESENKLMDINTPKWEVNEILECRNRAMNVYEVKIRL